MMETMSNEDRVYLYTNPSLVITSSASGRDVVHLIKREVDGFSRKVQLFYGDEVWPNIYEFSAVPSMSGDTEGDLILVIYLSSLSDDPSLFKFFSDLVSEISDFMNDLSRERILRIFGKPNELVDMSYGSFRSAYEAMYSGKSYEKFSSEVFGEVYRGYDEFVESSWSEIPMWKRKAAWQYITHEALFSDVLYMLHLLEQYGRSRGIGTVFSVAASVELDNQARYVYVPASTSAEEFLREISRRVKDDESCGLTFYDLEEKGRIKYWGSQWVGFIDKVLSPSPELFIHECSSSGVYSFSPAHFIRRFQRYFTKIDNGLAEFSGIPLDDICTYLFLSSYFRDSDDAIGLRRDGNYGFLNDLCRLCLSRERGPAFVSGILGTKLGGVFLKILRVEVKQDDAVVKRRNKK